MTAEPAKAARAWAEWLIGAFFIAAGAFHFVHPAPYVQMVPRYLPAPETLVWMSGVAEIAGGVGVLLPAVRTPAAWGLIALLVAVFPANLQVALHGWPGVSLPPWALWLRLPLQPVFIWIVYHFCIARHRRAPRNAGDATRT